MSAVVFVVLSLVLSLAQGQWVVQGNYNSSDCKSELVNSYVQEIGACLTLSASASTMYKMDGSGYLDWYFCQDANCTQGCFNLGQTTLNTCEQAPSLLSNLKRAALPETVEDVAPYNFYYLSNTFPSSLMASAEILVQYKEQDACVGEPNLIVITPGSCMEYCYENYLTSCSVPKGLNSTHI